MSSARTFASFVLITVLALLGISPAHAQDYRYNQKQTRTGVGINIPIGNRGGTLGRILAPQGGITIQREVSTQRGTSSYPAYPGGIIAPGYGGGYGLPGPVGTYPGVYGGPQIGGPYATWTPSAPPYGSTVWCRHCAADHVASSYCGGMWACVTPGHGWENVADVCHQGFLAARRAPVPVATPSPRVAAPAVDEEEEAFRRGYEAAKREAAAERARNAAKAGKKPVDRDEAYRRGVEAAKREAERDTPDPEGDPDDETIPGAAPPLPDKPSDKK